jgi:hypothetical protein
VVATSLLDSTDSEFRECGPHQQVTHQREREERRRGGEHSCGSVRKDEPAEAENHKAQQDEAEREKREFHESVAVHSVGSWVVPDKNA